MEQITEATSRIACGDEKLQMPLKGRRDEISAVIKVGQRLGPGQGRLLAVAKIVGMSPENKPVDRGRDRMCRLSNSRNTLGCFDY